MSFAGGVWHLMVQSGHMVTLCIGHPAVILGRFLIISMEGVLLCEAPRGSRFLNGIARLQNCAQLRKEPRAGTLGTISSMVALPAITVDT